ncbi:hypothetical protein EJB05_43038, partial [Eragrostis curvula]
MSFTASLTSAHAIVIFVGVVAPRAPGCRWGIDLRWRCGVTAAGRRCSLDLPGRRGLRPPLSPRLHRGGGQQVDVLTAMGEADADEGAGVSWQP